MKPDIYKVQAIGEGFLAVMAKPVSGEWIEEEFAGIADQDIRQIVSLLEIQEAYELGLNDEKSLAEKNSMKFISFPIQDRGLPESAEKFKELALSLHKAICSGVNTVIHCRAGIGRTGIVAAGVLINAGLMPEEAFSIISSKRGIEVPDTEQQRNWILDAYDSR